MTFQAEIRATNFYRLDANLQRLLNHLAPNLLVEEGERLAAFGAWVGGDVDEQAHYTNRFAPPSLSTYDRQGELANEVRYNPLYQAVHRDVYRRGFVGLNYGAAPKPYLLTFTMGYLLAESDISIHCPATLTGAVAYVIARHAPLAVKDAFLDDLVRMDGGAKTGGTWVTEIEGGSDVGAARTVARPSPNGHRLSGIKWFASNADCELALATARPDGAVSGTNGLGLYLIPKSLNDGQPNRYCIRHLKEKLGTRGLATGEIELLETHAIEIAPPPEGFKLMMEALEYSRIHNAVAGAGLQRRAFVEAMDYATQRRAFGQSIASYPMVQEALLDILVPLEAGMALAFEAARAFDAVQTDETQRPWLRIVTALAKFQTAEDAVAAASRAIEVLGGNGYTEEYVTARLLRDAQVLPVWEGPANIQALELLRLMTGHDDAFETFESRLDAALAPAEDELAELVGPVSEARNACRRVADLVRRKHDEGPRRARRILALMADTLAAALLLEEAAVDLGSGDARKALIARRFIVARLAPPRHHGVEQSETWQHRLFRQLVGYETIDPRDASPDRADSPAK